MTEQTSSDKPSSSTSEESVKPQTPSIEFTDMVIPYASHIMTDDGRLAGFKIKTKSKDFHYEGESSGTLFGQHLFPDSGKRIVITEGELDAASCYEVMSGWPMVSLPHGAAAARKTCRKPYPSCKATKRSSSSSTTTTQGVRPLNLPRAYYQPVGLRLLDSMLTKMQAMHSKLTTKTQ